MGSTRWCKTCNSAHESPTGSRCKKQAMEQETTEQGRILLQTQEGATSLNDRSVTEPLSSPDANNKVLKSPHKPDHSHAILLELQKMTSRFGQIEKQAAEDRAILSGLVKRLDEPSIATSSVSSPTLGSQKDGTMSNAEPINAQVGAQRNTSLLHNTVSTGVKSKQMNGKNTDGLQTSTINPSLGANRVQFQSNVDTTAHQTGQKLPQGVYQLQMGPSGMEMRPIQCTSTMVDGFNSISRTSHNLTTQPNAVVPPETFKQGGFVMGDAFGGARPKVGTQQQLSKTLIDTPLGAGPEVQTRFQPQEVVSQQIMGGSVSGGMTTQPIGNRDGHAIPSLDSLRQATDINQRVQERYKELEEASNATTTGKFELLLDAFIKDKKIDKKKVKWPQDQAFIGVMRKRPTYEQLTLCQWLLGFLRIQQEETDTTIRDNMITYLCELMQDVCDFTWDSAKGAHAVLLHRMADGVVDWTQPKEIHKIRKRYAQTNSSASVSEKKVSKIVPCIKFNKGICQKSGDHEWQGLMLKHMCQFCFQTFSRTEGHARKDCWKAQKETGSKN